MIKTINLLRIFSPACHLWETRWQIQSIMLLPGMALSSKCTINTKCGSRTNNDHTKKGVGHFQEAIRQQHEHLLGFYFTSWKCLCVQRSSRDNTFRYFREPFDSLSLRA